MVRLKRISYSGLALSLAFLMLAAPSYSSEFRASDVQDALNQLYSNIDSERASGAASLGEMGAEGKAAIPALIGLLKSDPSMQVRGNVAKSLGNMGSVASLATPALIEFLKSSEGGYERTYAATAIGQVGASPEQAVPALVEALQHDQEPVVRRLAARAVGDFHEKGVDAIPALIEAIKTGSKEMREAAADGLQNIPARQSDVPLLLPLLSDEVTCARYAASKSLVGAGQSAVEALPALLKLLNDSDSGTKRNAMICLGEIGPGAKSALPALRLALKDPEMRDSAEAAIAKIKSRH